MSWLLAGWVLTTTALAGPAWRREPALFADDTAALAVVVKVTPSMRTRDVQPDRLTRGVEKVRDLLALRPGAKTALIAYAGSVHRVLPLTRDADVINTFAGELSPEIMPVEGDAAAAALALAQDVVAKSGQPGWVLWIADAVESDQVAALARDRVHSRVPVDVLGVVGEGDERSSLERAVDALGARFVPVTPDDADVRRLVGRTSFSASAESEGGERWQDAGYWLVPPVVLMSLLSFRRGWMVRTAAV